MAGNRRRGAFGMLMVVVAVAINGAVPGRVQADESRWAISLQAARSFADRDESFNQIDLMASYRLPWQWEWRQAVEVGTYFTSTVGLLNGGGDTGFVGSTGLELVFQGKDSPFAFRTGGAVALLGEEEYGDEDFGGPVQFIFRLGVDYRIVEKLRLIARAQHMSNGGLYRTNPGVNLVMLGLQYSF